MGKDIVTVKLTLGLPSQFMPIPAMGLNYGGANHFCLGKLVLVVVFFSILIIAAGSRFGSMTSFKLIALILWNPKKAIYSSRYTIHLREGTFFYWGRSFGGEGP